VVAGGGAPEDWEVSSGFVDSGIAMKYNLSVVMP
jgi:hypothetical protein